MSLAYNMFILLFSGYFVSFPSSRKSYFEVFALNCRIFYQKELSLCNNHWFSNPYIFRFQCRRPLIFQTICSVRSNNIGLNYQRFIRLGFKEIKIRKSEFVAKNQKFFLVPFSSFSLLVQNNKYLVVTDFIFRNTNDAFRRFDLFFYNVMTKKSINDKNYVVCFSSFESIEIATENI